MPRARKGPSIPHLKRQQKYKSTCTFKELTHHTLQSVSGRRVGSDDHKSCQSIDTCDLNPTSVSMASPSPKHEYTGTFLIGIGTMHKSNAVPITSQEQAIDIARMRRG